MEQEQFKFENYSISIGSHGKDKLFKWKVFISKNEPDEKLEKVRSVEYRLSESFPDPIRLVQNRNSRFALESESWYNFPIYITVNLEDNRVTLTKYDLDLNKNWPLEELKGINLKSADLEKANFRNADLRDANLRNSNLIGADLSNADLTDAKLVHAKLNRAKLVHAKLYNADLQHAKLLHTDLNSANLEIANLKDADLSSAILTNANLEKANLFNARLKGVHLEGANLKDADLGNADLENAIFNKNTDFQGAKIDDITIYNLKGSNWLDANWDLWKLEDIKKKHGDK